jgi:hypothetical protein
MKVHFKGNLGGLAGGGNGVTGAASTPGDWCIASSPKASDEDELAAARVSGPWVRLSYAPGTGALDSVGTILPATFALASSW